MFTTPQAIIAINEIKIPFAKSILYLFESFLNNNSFLIEINKVALTRFETRKCVFDTSKLNEDDIFTGLKNAVLFELLWLKSKQSYNNAVTEEDNVRIKMLEKRHIYNTSSCS